MTTLLKQFQAAHAEALDPTGGPEVLTGMLDVLMAEVERAQSGADGLLVNMALTHQVEELTAENERLRAAMGQAHLWMENQLDAQSKGGHATFDLMTLSEERDAIAAAMRGPDHAG